MVPPSSSTLRDRHEWFLNETKDEYSSISRAVTASFNLDELKSAASRLMKMDCATVHLIGEGGFNQVFILTFEDGTDIIARLNGSFGQQDLTQPSQLLDHRVASEAATLDFVRSNTSIPVPTVLSTVTDASNPVGARYTLQTRIQGQSLGDVWQSMSEDQIKSVVTQVANYEGQLLRTRFSSIGSLVTDPITQKPCVGKMGLSCIETYALRQDVGPWTSSGAYVKAHLHATIDLLENHPEEWIANVKMCQNINHDEEVSLQYMRRWYSLFDLAVDLIKLDEHDDPEIPFFLCHEDISKNNILVDYDDPTHIVGIIDWEGAKVVPLWTWLEIDRLLECYGPPDDQLKQLRSLRASIHVEIQPFLRAVQETSGLWLGLLRFASLGVSIQYDLTLLNAELRSWLEDLPAAVRRSFTDLECFINSGLDTPE